MTIRAGLPFAVRPPKPGTYSTLRRPQPVHRLDKPTSGLLLVAKTKPAMVHLSHQFRDRKVKKTYVAVVNGIPPEPKETKISAVEAFQLGVDVNPQSPGSDCWQMIDSALDEKSAVTIWKALKYSKSLKAKDDHVTLVELKPKTGRYHQLRRHMAWICDTPIIGDSDYDGGGEAMQLRDRGLFLCSNRVTLEHPYYNDLGESAEDVYSNIPVDEREHLWVSPEGKVMVTASIDIPAKFDSFMEHADERYRKLSAQLGP
jgi:23S rRNA-/tRNA-specific pseudouridylate synthase